MTKGPLYSENGAFLRMIDVDEARDLIVSKAAESRYSGYRNHCTEIHLVPAVEVEERPLLHFPVGRQPVYREHMEYGRPWTFRRVWKAAQVPA